MSETSHPSPPAIGTTAFSQYDENVLHWILGLRNRHYFLFDILLLLFTPTLAVMLAGGGWVRAASAGILLPIFTLLSLLIKLPVFYRFRFYGCYWRFAGLDEMISILKGVAAAFLGVIALFTAAQIGLGPHRFSLPYTLPIVDAFLTLIAVTGTRFAARVAGSRRLSLQKGQSSKRVLVIGAGEAGAMIVREMKSSARIDLIPVGFLDDDAGKQGAAIHGVRVLGLVSDLPRIARETNAREAIIAMPTVSGKRIRSILRLCEDAGLASRLLPGIPELLNGRISFNQVRSVEIGDLLRREPVEMDAGTIRGMLAGKRVLVTGAGGSIGSELCSQILGYQPAQIIALGHGENSIFNLINQLERRRSTLNGKGTAEVIPVLADVRDRSRLDFILSKYRPEIVFHTAAHKHVPLSEANADDAITTNVLGTRNLLELSQAYQVERFIFISTDKAVNPVNVLGMTKRVAELLVKDAYHKTEKPYAIVRFGNVLGSRGSVVPFFQQQIAVGGPVTITHPDIIRFFMTIPEAVQLVLQSATLSEGGETFVLDMGEPVKIVDLARDMIELSGYQVGRDIDITFTGLRPGEKLSEELFAAHEHPERTGHTKIIASCAEEEPVIPSLQQEVDELIAYARSGQIEACRKKLEFIARYPES